MSKTLGITAPVRNYVQRWGVREHPALARCRGETQAAGWRTGYHISPEQGAIMALLARSVRARRAIEIGVFTGYSALAVALVLSDLHGDCAELVACELSGDLIAQAQGYWREARPDGIVTPRIGPALDTIQGLIAEGAAGTFDYAFVDADKTRYPEYYEACLALLRQSGLLLLDNMLWGGDVANPDRHTEKTDTLRALAAQIHGDERVDMTLATLGDGLSIIIKR